MQTVRPNRTIYQLAHLWDRQFLLVMRQEKLRYHHARADEVYRTKSIDNYLTLSNAQSITPVAKPQVRTDIIFPK